MLNLKRVVAMVCCAAAAFLLGGCEGGHPHIRITAAELLSWDMSAGVATYRITVENQRLETCRQDGAVVWVQAYASADTHLDRTAVLSDRGAGGWPLIDETTELSVGESVTFERYTAPVCTSERPYLFIEAHTKPGRYRDEECLKNFDQRLIYLPDGRVVQ